MYKFGLASIDSKWFWLKLYVLLTMIGIFLIPFYLFFNTYIDKSIEPYQNFITSNKIEIHTSNNQNFPLYGKKLNGTKLEYYAIYPNYYIKSTLLNCSTAQITDELTWCEDMLVRYLYTGEVQDLRQIFNKSKN